MFKKNNPSRFEIIDQLKAIAVIMMVLFHLFYDLSLFDFISIDRKALSFRIWPKIIITLFLICMGLNLRNIHFPNIKWRGIRKRFLKLSLLALVISIATYFVFPSNWVYFGILHFIAFASIISLPFQFTPRLSLILGAVVIIPSLVLGYKYPFISLSEAAVDHVPPLPWLGVVLIGFFLHSINFHKIKVPEYPGKELMNFLGKYSLEIYISHQAILFPVIYLLSLITK